MREKKIISLRSAGAYWDPDHKAMTAMLSGERGGNGEIGKVDLNMLSEAEKETLIKELDRRFTQLWDKVAYERKHGLVDYKKMI